MIEIISIVYKPESVGSDPKDHYARVPLASATLVVGRGIEGDRKGGHPNRQLNIMSLEALRELRAEGFRTGPGQMGEQIVIGGLDVGTLTAGDRLQTGDQAWVEVINPRTGCDRFERIQGKSPELAAGRLGVIAKVVTGGAIRVGDPVRVVHQAAIGA
ncbi:MAG: MOSC domain-containing protein [Anaerolineales bacterium]